MTFNTLLIPTNGSDPAENAARRGFDLAAQCGADVHILSVADSSIAAGAGYSGNSQSIRKRLREKAAERAERLQAEAADLGLDATAKTREGIPAKQVVEYADETDIDGIAIGTSGRGGVRRAVMGSVADKVVRTASVPVVTINPKAAAEDTSVIDSILVPTDGSETASTMASWSISLASQLDATVHLLTVIDSEQAEARTTLSGSKVDISDALRGQARDHHESLAEEANAAGVDVTTTIRDGIPADGIIEYADSENIDLIAMGTAGRGGFDRFLLGSVADKVLRTAPVPVVTMRPEKPESQ